MAPEPWSRPSPLSPTPHIEKQNFKPAEYRDATVRLRSGQRKRHGRAPYTTRLRPLRLTTSGCGVARGAATQAAQASGYGRGLAPWREAGSKDRRAAQVWLGALGSCLPWAWRGKTHRRAGRGGHRWVGARVERCGRRGLWRQTARAVRSVATGNSVEVRNAGRLATRKLVQILLYVGCVERHPGPGREERRARVGTLNVPGLHMLRRSRVGRVEETGWDDVSDQRFLLSTAADGLWGCGAGAGAASVS